jgi:hypothetical protein
MTHFGLPRVNFGTLRDEKKVTVTSDMCEKNWVKPEEVTHKKYDV